MIRRASRSPEECRALAGICYRKLAEWDLSQRQRLLAWWIITLTFAQGRETVDLTGRKLAELMGVDAGDVTRTLQSLESACVVHRLSTRPLRLCFLPEAALVAPGYRVPEETRARVLAEIEAMQPAAPGEDATGQKYLEIETTAEALERDQANASAELAIDRDRERLQRENEALRRELAALRANPPQMPARRTPAPAMAPRVQMIRPDTARAELEARLQARGATADEIEASRAIPLERLGAAFRSLFAADIGETPTPAPTPDEAPAHIGEPPMAPRFSAAIAPQTFILRPAAEIGGTPTPATSAGRPAARVGISPMSPAAPSVGAGEIGHSPTCTVRTVTVYPKAKAKQETENHSATPSAGEWTKPAQADPELMQLCRELIGEHEWTQADPETKRGNYGALWCNVLRSSPVAPSACYQAIAATKDALTRGAIAGSVGAYLYGAFRNIHRRALQASQPRPKAAPGGKSRPPRKKAKAPKPAAAETFAAGAAALASWRETTAAASPN